MLIKRFLMFVLAMTVLLVAGFGCNHEEDKNLPHDSSLNPKPAPTQGGPGAKGVQPPPP